MTLDLMELLPAGWRDAVRPHLSPDTVATLSAFVDEEYRTAVVYPPLPDLFSAFRLCDPTAARVLVLGQDPYHKEGQAHGLSFSVRQGVPVPRSEEHTSELQSREKLVCRLLLENKKILTKWFFYRNHQNKLPSQLT